MISSLEKLQKFEGMNILVDMGGDVDYPIQEINNCSVQRRNNRILLQDEDDNKMPVAISEKIIDNIEDTYTGEEIIHLKYDLNMRIMIH